LTFKHQYFTLRYINLNGKLTEEANASVSHDNRAFRYGYGLFETMLIRDGEIQLASYHFERLFAGMKALALEIPKLMMVEWLEEEIKRTVRKNQLEQLCRVRLQVYAGSGGLLETANPKAEFITECFPLDEHITQLNETGLVVGIAEGVAKAVDSIANYKTTNALVYAIAAQQTKANKWNDALMLNTEGNIIESTIANIFWIKDGQLYTPPLSEGCVAGVMRRYIMSKTPVIEQPLSIDILNQADEVFLTNAIRGMKWVGSIGEKTYRNSHIHKLYSQLLA
jgi:branched-chain amino acid aminotransferase